MKIFSGARCDFLRHNNTKKNLVQILQRLNPEEVFFIQNCPDLGPFFWQTENIAVNI